MNLDAALLLASDPDWERRQEAATALGDHHEDDRAFATLVRMLDDANSAVGRQAAYVLALRGGTRGLSAALVAIADGPEAVAPWIRDALVDVDIETGYQLVGRVEALLDADDEAVRRGALEMKRDLP